MRGSIAVLVLFMTVICGFSVSAAEVENAEVCTEAAEESAEAAGAEVVSVFRMADLQPLPVLSYESEPFPSLRIS